MTSDNPLNVRLILSKSRTTGTKDSWTKTIATIESDKPAGVDALEALNQLSANLDAYLSPRAAEQKPTLEAEKPGSTSPPLDLSPYDQLWKSNSKGSWIFSDKAPDLKALLAGSPKKTVEIQGQTYKLSGDSDQFINRYGSRKDPAK
jgi:hypothetical protein